MRTVHKATYDTAITRLADTLIRNKQRIADIEYRELDIVLTVEQLAEIAYLNDLCNSAYNQLCTLAAINY